LQQSSRYSLLFLLASIALGLGLRFTHLTDKCLWTDELATLVFSLGHSFQDIPLDPQINLGGVVEHLLTESNHPPLYFLLTHLWLRLFSTSDGLVSLWGARSLSALLGVAAVPAIFGLGYLAFRSLPIAQLAALLMATSPLAIYLAQEARHYTLPILWVIASLACLMAATRALAARRPLPFGVMLVWVVVNGLGVASHYFFSLTLCAEGIVLLGLAGRQVQHSAKPLKLDLHLQSDPPLRATWLRIAGVGAGTLASLAVWLPFLQGVQDSEITQWIHRGDRVGLEWIDPVLQLLAGAITMLYMLPIQASNVPLSVVSFVVLVVIAIWTGWQTHRGLKIPGSDRHAVQILSGFVWGAIATFLVITYGFEREVTSAPRYHFVFFPAILLLVAAALVQQWFAFPSARTAWVKRTAVIVASLSLLGAITVVSNLGYQKTHRPDIVTQAIRDAPPRQSLIAILHSTHGQTGRLMAIAWDLKHQPLPQPPLFLMAHAADAPESVLVPLEKSLAQIATPLNLWLLEFNEVPEDRLQATLVAHNCQPDPQIKAETDGYRYRLHVCAESPQN
jgi:uncharacterized membrane protein